MSLCAWALDESEAHLHSDRRSWEHVLGQQFGALVEGTGVYTYDRIHHDAEDKRLNSSRSWSSDEAVDWVTKAFCDQCNNGWMARIDDRAFPVANRLLGGEPPFELSDEESGALASWAYKVSLGFDFVAAPVVRHATAVRSDFFRTRLVPAHAAVVAGLVDFAYANALHGLRTGDGPIPALGPIRVFTLLLKRVVVQVASSCHGTVGLPPLDLVPLRPTARAVVHPRLADERSWPPSVVITDETDLRGVVAAVGPFPRDARPSTAQ